MATAKKLVPVKRSAPAKKTAPVKGAAPAPPKKAAPVKKKIAPAPVKKAPAKKAVPVPVKKASPAPKPTPAPAKKRAAVPVVMPAIVKPAIATLPDRPLNKMNPPRPKRIIPPFKKPVPRNGPVVIDKFLEAQLKLLGEERATYTRQAANLKAEADLLVLDKDPGDTQFDDESGEGDTINFERERDLVMSAQARAAVEEIDLAVKRVYEGTYGTCAKCQQPIPKERLKAIPWAALCVRCKAGGLGR